MALRASQTNMHCIRPNMGNSYPNFFWNSLYDWIRLFCVARALSLSHFSQITLNFISISILASNYQPYKTLSIWLWTPNRIEFQQHHLHRCQIEKKNHKHIWLMKWPAIFISHMITRAATASFSVSNKRTLARERSMDAISESLCTFNITRIVIIIIITWSEFDWDNQSVCFRLQFKIFPLESLVSKIVSIYFVWVRWCFYACVRAYAHMLTIHNIHFEI